MIFLNVPYKDKDKAKQLGARWNSEKKKWYIPENNLMTPFEQWLDKIEFKQIKNKSGTSKYEIIVDGVSAFQSNSLVELELKFDELKSDKFRHLTLRKIKNKMSIRAFHKNDIF